MGDSGDSEPLLPEGARPNGVGRSTQLLTTMLRHPAVSKVLRPLMVARGSYFPEAGNIGEDVLFHHLGSGVICRTNTVIGKRCEIYPGVILGSASLGGRDRIPSNCRVVLEDDVIVGSGAYVLAKEEVVLGQGTVVAANSVLLNSTEPFSVWAGNPAIRIK